MINNETKGFGKFFWHSISLKKKSPIYHRYPTHEVDEPYRWSNSHIIRLPWASKGLVVGWWQNTSRTEEQAILDAIEGRRMGTGEFTDAEKNHIRHNMVKKQYPSDVQALLVEVLDLS